MTAGSRLDKRGEDMVKYEGDKLLFMEYAWKNLLAREVASQAQPNMPAA